MKMSLGKSFFKYEFDESKLPAVDKRKEKQLLWFAGISYVVMMIIIGFGVAGENGKLPIVFRSILLTLSFITTFGSLIVGAFLILRSQFSGNTENREIAEEVEALANDASFDVSEQIIFWDKLKYTKGVGTQLEGREEEIDTICRRLENVRQEISNAESPQHRLEAVLSADSLLATARSLH